MMNRFQPQKRVKWIDTDRDGRSSAGVRRRVEKGKDVAAILAGRLYDSEISFRIMKRPNCSGSHHVSYTYMIICLDCVQYCNILLFVDSVPIIIDSGSFVFSRRQLCDIAGYCIDVETLI